MGPDWICCACRVLITAFSAVKCWMLTRSYLVKYELIWLYHKIQNKNYSNKNGNKTMEGVMVKWAKPPLEASASHFRMFRVNLCFLLLHIPAGIWWCICCSPCHPLGGVPWNPLPCLSPALAAVGIWESALLENLCLLSLSDLKKEIFS